mmetsp:Transcript_18009/g.30664  ORF Transcript_18009/g.30664 Transcript_18009/m.30664 type:complete len:151 (+) Transcript_18009:903-1355(+)
MLCGKPPHFSRDKTQLLRDLVEKPVPMKGYFSPEAKSLLQDLLQRDPKFRLGSAMREGDPDDAEAIRNHPFFRNIDWKTIKTRSHRAPFIPQVQGREDTSQIDQMFTREQLEETYVDPNKMRMELNLAQREQTHFEDFTYQKKASFLQQA